jgi:hypothetical protein
MKKGRKTLTLEKIQIAKLPNLNNIYGGATQVGGGCGTDNEEQQQQHPTCKATSDIIIDTNSEEQ